MTKCAKTSLDCIYNIYKNMIRKIIFYDIFASLIKKEYKMIKLSFCYYCAIFRARLWWPMWPFWGYLVPPDLEGV